MKKTAPLKNLSHDDWLLLRNKGIGGSDLGIIMGYSKYKSNIELWEEKTNLKQSEFKDSPATIRGKKSEEHILKLWEAFNAERVKVIIPTHSYCHSKYEWIRANFDAFGVVDGEKCIIEIKTAEVKNFNDWRDKVPMTYYLQCLHYMLVSGLKTAWIVVGIKLFGRKDISIKEYKITWNDKEIEMILENEKEFYNQVVTKKRPLLVKAI